MHVWSDHSLLLNNFGASHLMSGGLVRSFDVRELSRSGCQRWLRRFVFCFRGPIICDELLYFIGDARDERVCASHARTIDHWMGLNVFILEQALIRNFVFHLIQACIRVMADWTISPTFLFLLTRVRSLSLNDSPILSRQVKFVTLVKIFDLMSCLHHWTQLLIIIWLSSLSVL